LILISCHAKTDFANCYVVGPDAGGPAALIDPGYFDGSLLARIERAGLEIVAVLLTHSHRAHSGGVATVQSVYRARVYGRGGVGLNPLDQEVRDGQTVAVGGMQFQVSELPGHADDCVAFRIGDLLFTGDALLAGGIGSTPTAAARASLVAAIRDRVLCLPDRVTILPGHGPPTTVQVERTYNAALRRRG
jgi:glyoxylase-like metal-dependent hydrolase (beta-lactamase superfamily II)